MKKNSRRDFLKKGALLTIGSAAFSNMASASVFNKEPLGFTLPDLPYDYSALEPFIDTATMKVHHGKHHQGYVNNLNKALEDFPEWKKKTLNELLNSISQLPKDLQNAVRNNGGGHWNHDFFWKMLIPAEKSKMNAQLNPVIAKYYGDLDKLKSKFQTAAMSVFGSGWVWLGVNKQNDLEIITTPNQDNPLIDIVPHRLKPILGLDVWEHAYYLKHQNRRADYINDFWNVVNWDFVWNNYQEDMK